MRDAREPLTSTEIITALLRGWNVEPTPAAIRGLFDAANSSLRNQSGKTVERAGDGKPDRWALLRDNPWRPNTKSPGGMPGLFCSWGHTRKRDRASQSSPFRS